MSQYKHAKLFSVCTTTWGTATEPAAGGLVLAEEISWPGNKRNIIRQENQVGLESPAYTTPGIIEEQNLSFDYPLYYDSRMALLILKHALGTYAFTADSPEAGVNKHLLTLDETITSDLSLSFALDENDEVKSLDWSKIKSVNIKIKDSVMVMTVTAIGAQQSAQAAWTNTATADSHVGKYTFIYTGAYVRINAQSGGALAVGDNQTISNLEINIERRLKSSPATVGTAYIARLDDDSCPQFTMKWTYPAKDTTTNKAFFAAYNAQTIYKAEIKFVGPTITGKATAYSFTIDLPGLVVSEEPKYNIETPTPTDIAFNWVRALANPTGMASTLPYITVYNLMATL